MIECHNDEHLKSLFQGKGFETIGADQDEKQILCRICWGAKREQRGLASLLSFFIRYNLKS